MIDLTGDGVRVLLIATATHRGPTLTSTPTVERTYHDLRTALLERCGVRPDRLRAILDPADALTMASAVAEEAQRATGVLLVYFIGHGLLGPDDILHLAASSTDSLVPGMAVHQALSFATLREAITNSKARTRVVMLDCCYSGRASLGNARLTPAFDVAPANGMYFLGAAPQEALAPVDAVHTTFTGELIEVLTRGDPLESPMLTLDVVNRLLFRRMSDSGRPVPRYQADDRAGSLVIAPNPAALAPDRPNPDKEPTPGRCPWPSLRSFGVDDADVFFGRDEMIKKVLHAVTAAATDADPGAVVVVGSSGSGKSSLLHAGMRARMGKDDLPGLPGSTGWPFISLTPGENPLWRLAAQLADSPSDAAELLGEDPNRAGELVDARMADRPGERLIVVVDQLEELFTLCAKPVERAAFLKAMTAIAGRVGDGPPRGLVVFALRADFYDRALAYPDLRDRHVQVVPMTRDELCAAIEEPARVRGWELDKGLAGLIVDELIPTTDEQPETGALPLLSHVLWATWKRRERDRLTLAGYLQVGGISQAIATTAEEAYDGLSLAEKDAAQRMLLGLVRVGENSADTARPVERSALLYGLPDVAAARSALDKLTAARLLTVDHDTVRISHEALLRKWPDLREWIKSDRMNRIRRQKLEDAAKSWKDEGRHPETLYRGPPLADAREWAPHADLSSLAQEFFTRSVEHEEARKRDSWRRTKRLRRLLVLLAVLLVFALATSVVAVISLRFAQFRADSAIAFQASGVANDLRRYDTASAAQLALTAHRLMPGIETRSAISSVLTPPFLAPVSRHGDDVRTAAFSPDGRVLASGSSDRTVRLWNVTDPHRPTPLATAEGHGGPVTSVAFGPDGSVVASASDDGTVHLWNVADSRRLMHTSTVTGHGSEPLYVAFGRNGHILASGGPDDALRLWDVGNPSRPRPLGAVGGATSSLAFAPLASFVATGREDGTVWLWDVTDPRRPTRSGILGDHDGAVTSVAFSPDGHTLATVGQDRLVQLWDVTDPRRPTRSGILGDHHDVVTSVAFNPDGRILASAEGNRPRLWDVTDPRRPGELGGLPAHTGAIRFMAFSTDGRTLASGGDDHVVRLAGLSGPVLRRHTDTVYSVASSPDGRAVATGSWDATVRLWDVTDSYRPEPLAALTGHASNVKPVAFSPDGRLLASGSDDTTVRLWDVTDVRRPAPHSVLKGHTHYVATLAISPTGDILASAGDDATVRLWDIADPARPAPMSTIEDHDEVVLSVAFGPDGRTLASAGADRTVRLWDVTDPRRPVLLSTFRANAAAVTSLVFHPDGRTLAVGSRDRTVRLWDVTDPRRPEPPSTPIDAGSEVDSLDFSHDGRTLVTGQQDGALRLWEVSDPDKPELLTYLRGHDGRINSVTFSPDSRTVVSGSADRTGRVWEVEPERVEERICVLTAHADAAAEREWERRYPNDDYRSPCLG